MITTLLAAAGALLAALGALLGHWLGTRKTEAKVAEAKTATEAATRDKVAEESKVAAGQAMTEAAAVRNEAITASTGKTREELLAEMRANGEIGP